MFDSGDFESDKSSRTYFFLPLICDRNEEINKYLGSVNIHPIDIPESDFCRNFNPSKLEYGNSEKLKMLESVVNTFKKIIQLSNSNLVKNVDALTNKLPPETEVEWIGKEKKRVLNGRFKLTYYILFFRCSSRRGLAYCFAVYICG